MRFWRAATVTLGMLSLVTGGVAATQGCSLLTSYEGFTEAGAPPASTATCGPRIPTNTAKPAGSVDKGILVGATTAIRFPTLNDDLRLFSFDLDENCATVACSPTSGPPRSIGIDNVAGAFISKLQNNADISIDALKHGLLGIVVQVQEWNGTDTDDAVNVSLFNVAGLNGSSDGGAVQANDGNDVYIARTDDVFTSPIAKPAFTSNQAYVTKKQLVARFPGLRIRLFTPNFSGAVVSFDLPLVEPVLVGTITLAAGGIQMPDGRLVGRVRDTDMLRVISQLGACSSAPLYPGLKAQLCAILDLTDSKNTDGQKRPCVTASLGFQVVLTPAKLATVTAPAPLGPLLCDTDPSDSCGSR